jgi:hypothetical protein
MKMDCVLKEGYLLLTKMSSKYVPPAMRKKEKAAPAPPPPPPPPEKKFEDEFPTLTSAPPAVRVWGGTTTFAEKAREWSEQAARDAEEALARKQAEAEVRPPNAARALPRFHNVRRFVEQEEEVEEEENDYVKPNDEDSGWTLVERKARKKPKSLTQIADEELAKASDEDRGDSVWNDDKELHETCWDERY